MNCYIKLLLCSCSLPEDQESQEISLGKLGKKIGPFGNFIRKIRKKIGPLGKFVGKIRKVGGETKKKKKKKKGPHLILVGKLGKFDHIRKVQQANQENFHQIRKISPNQENFCQIRKDDQENQEKFGKLGKLGGFIRKNHRILGKFTPNIRKGGGET